MNKWLNTAAGIVEQMERKAAVVWGQNRSNWPSYKTQADRTMTVQFARDGLQWYVENDPITGVRAAQLIAERMAARLR